MRALTVGNRVLGGLLGVGYVATYIAPAGVFFEERVTPETRGTGAPAFTDDFRAACARFRYIEDVTRHRAHRFTVSSTDDCPDLATFERSIARAARSALNTREARLEKEAV